VLAPGWRRAWRSRELSQRIYVPLREPLPRGIRQALSKHGGLVSQNVFSSVIANFFGAPGADALVDSEQRKTHAFGVLPAQQRQMTKDSPHA
jgi:hypothetical protein